MDLASFAHKPIIKFFVNVENKFLLYTMLVCTHNNSCFCLYNTSAACFQPLCGMFSRDGQFYIFILRSILPFAMSSSPRAITNMLVPF